MSYLKKMKMVYKERAKGRHSQHRNKGISLACQRTGRSSACLENGRSGRRAETEKAAKAILEKVGCQAEELDLVLEVMKSKIRIFGKLILEAICEEWVRIRLMGKNEEAAVMSK